MMRFALVFVLLTGCALGPPPFGDRLKKEVDRAALRTLRSGNHVDLVVGVLRGGKFWIFGYGKNKPNGQTLFEIGSVTKVFTGRLLADLVATFGEITLETSTGPRAATDLLAELDAEMPPGPGRPRIGLRPAAARPMPGRMMPVVTGQTVPLPHHAALLLDAGTLRRVDVPRLVLDVVHSGGKAGELTRGWSQVLEEMPQLTVFFDELEFSQAQDIGGLRSDLPIGPIMDFLLEVVDRTIASKNHLVVGSTSHPDTLRPAFLSTRRFERIVEVNPIFPDDVIETLQIHAEEAEKRAGRELFDGIDWRQVIGQTREAAPGDWVRILHAVLRLKARQEAAQESVTPVTTANLKEEVERFKNAEERLRVPEGGNYL